MDLLIGTSNPGKLREYRALLESLPVRLVTLRDVGLEALDIEETADTFEGNAVLKARAYAAASGLWTLADDSGLVVDALGGLPGVQSHRYAGPGASDEARYQKLLKEMENVSDDARSARFVCVVALCAPDLPEPIVAVGTVEGRIARSPGENVTGFGYDPVFIPEGYTAPFSALPMEVKNRLSHRGNALRNLVPTLRQLLESQAGD